MPVLERNNVTVFGEGTNAIVFAHGFGCDQHMWRYIAPHFAADYQVILFDLVGAGRSDLTAYTPQKYSSIKGYANDLLEICDALGLHQCIFVGHSVSAMIGVLAARQRPEQFSKLVLLCPSPRYLNDINYEGGFTQRDIDELLEYQESNYLGWAHDVAGVIMQNAERPELAEELESSFCRTDPIIARQFAEVTFRSDNRDDLQFVTAPTLIVQCVPDSLAPRFIGDYVHSAIPTSELVVLSVAGHCPHLSAPTETLAAMSVFLGN